MQGKELWFSSTQSMKDPAAWGLSVTAARKMARRIPGFVEEWASCFKTRSWDNRFNAEVYVEGLLTVETNRNFKNISRRTISVDDDGQTLQHFMSESPWDANAVFSKIQRKIAENPEMSGGMLIVDESADARADGISAGTARQYSGRLGKVDSCQQAVGLSYYKSGICAMVDCDLYMPRKWFDEEKYRQLWDRLRIPGDLVFKTRSEMAKKMILQTKSNGLPFSMVCFDEHYGQCEDLRATLSDEGIIYIGDVANDALVYIEKPELVVPKNHEGKRGRKFSKPRPSENLKPVNVNSLLNHPSLMFKRYEIRPCERGILSYVLAFKRVWTITKDGRIWEHWLIIRKNSEKDFTYSLSNAPADMPPEKLAWHRCQRYFVERTFQDCKSSLGWDDLQAIKYSAWKHHAALTALSLWFIAEIKFDWIKEQYGDLKLYEDGKIMVSPILSVNNVREILAACLGRNGLTINEALRVVMDKFEGRRRSTMSRLKKGEKRKLEKRLDKL